MFDQCSTIKTRGKRCKNRARWSVSDSRVSSGAVCYGHSVLHVQRYGGTAELLPSQRTNTALR